MDAFSQMEHESGATVAGRPAVPLAYAGAAKRRHYNRPLMIAMAVVTYLLILLLSARAMAQQVIVFNELTVSVAPETVAVKERLTLGDIAQVSANDQQLMARLRAVDLGYAPDAGAVRQLPIEAIILAITTAGFAPGSVRLEGPPVAIIRRATQTIDPAYIREAVERAIVHDPRAAWTAARLVRLDLPNAIEVPAGATEVRAAIGGGRDLFSPFIASIEIWADSHLLRRLSANAQAEAYAAVLVAIRDLPAGARLQEEDVTVEMRRLEHPISSYLKNPKGLRGVAMRRSIAHGEALVSDAVFADIVIKPGDPVRVIGESGRIYVEVKGEARAAGRVGDRIQVKNAQSGILLQAVIEDEGVVRVRF
jgi:flagella basal body P-ring formation protein FlgA